MKTIKVKTSTQYHKKDVQLTNQELVMLYNACAEIVNDSPEMVGYRNLATKLLVITKNKSHENN